MIFIQLKIINYWPWLEEWHVWFCIPCWWTIQWVQKLIFLFYCFWFTFQIRHTHTNKKSTFSSFFLLHNIQTVYSTNSMSTNFFQGPAIKFGDNALSEFNRSVFKYWVNICQVLCYCMLFFSLHICLCVTVNLIIMTSQLHHQEVIVMVRYKEIQ